MLKEAPKVVRDTPAANAAHRPSDFREDKTEADIDGISESKKENKRRNKNRGADAIVIPEAMLRAKAASPQDLLGNILTDWTRFVLIWCKQMDFAQ